MDFKDYVQSLFSKLSSNNTAENLRLDYMWAVSIGSELGSPAILAVKKESKPLIAHNEESLLTGLFFSEEPLEPIGVQFASFVQLPSLWKDPVREALSTIPILSFDNTVFLDGNTYEFHYYTATSDPEIMLRFTGPRPTSSLMVLNKAFRQVAHDLTPDANDDVKEFINVCL